MLPSLTGYVYWLGSWVTIMLFKGVWKRLQGYFSRRDTRTTEVNQSFPGRTPEQVSKKKYGKGIFLPVLCMLNAPETPL